MVDVLALSFIHVLAVNSWLPWFWIPCLSSSPTGILFIFFTNGSHNDVSGKKRTSTVKSTIGCPRVSLSCHLRQTTLVRSESFILWNAFHLSWISYLWCWRSRITVDQFLGFVDYLDAFLVAVAILWLDIISSSFSCPTVNASMSLISAIIFVDASCLVDDLSYAWRSRD